MNCREASELLAAAVLGDLDRERQRAVHTHLAGCDRCLVEEDDLFESMRLLRAHGDVEPGAGFHRRVMARAAAAAAENVRPLLPPQRRVGLLTQTLLTAAATALIVVGLQTALASWRQGPALSRAGAALSGTTPADQGAWTTSSLLRGTLFDRRRNIPNDLRQRRLQWRRGATPRPLDL
jgi:anti-sigma factor RsiW